MDLKCPSCQKELELFDCSVPRQKLVCPSCESEFLSASDLTFLYGTRLPPGDTGAERVGCPYCRQRYGIDYTLQDGLIGCQYCLKIFAVPPPDTRAPVLLVAEDSAPKRNLTSEYRETTAKIRGPSFERIRKDMVSESSGPAVPNVEPPPEKPPASGKSKPEWVLLVLRIMGNIVWLTFGGLAFALINIFWGVVYCCTVIGIPFGLQLFKIATLQLCPFGADVFYPKDKPVGCLCTGFNILWILFGGLWSALGNFIVGAFMCCTIIGIPFGLQYFKLGKLVFAPFGLEIRRTNSMLVTYITAAVLLFVIPSGCNMLMLAVAPAIPKQTAKQTPKESAIDLNEPPRLSASSSTPAVVQPEEKKPTMLIEEVTDDRGNTYIVQTPAPGNEEPPRLIKLKRKKIAAITNEITDSDGNVFIIAE